MLLSMGDMGWKAQPHKARGRGPTLYWHGRPWRHRQDEPDYLLMTDLEDSAPLFGMGQASDVGKTPVRFVEIPEGVQGTAATIDEMRTAAIDGAKEPRVIFLARKIVRDVPSRDYMGEVRAVYTWVRDNIKYRLDPHTPPNSLGDPNYLADYIQTPTETLDQKQGDCDDHSTLLCSLMLAIGKGCGVETCSADRRRPEQASHVYAVAGLKKAGGVAWVPMDTTEPSKPMGWRPGPPFAWNTQRWVFANP